MSNPQKEDGYTPIANEIMEALAHIRISGEARQILDVILRKTYGWSKCEDVISLSQFVEMTGINKPNVCRNLNKLLGMNIITKKDNEWNVTYGLQKDYKKWKPLSKKITLSKKIISVIQKDNKSLSKKIHTKAIKKTKKTMVDIPYEEIINYLNEKAGKHFEPTSKTTRECISARWNENPKFRDIKAFEYVIDVKCKDWLDDRKQSAYLRPITLFGTKFEGYLNEVLHE